MKTPQMVNIKNYLSENTTVIKPSQQSPEEKFVPEIIPEYGRISGFFKVRVFLFPILVKTLLNIRKSYKSIQKNPASTKINIQPDVLKDFEDYAKRKGCSQKVMDQVRVSLLFIQTLKTSHVLTLMSTNRPRIFVILVTVV